MLSLHYGQDQIEVATDAHILVAVRHPPPPPPLADLGAAVARALEEPVGFPPLRRALTPDDHLVILVDDSLPRLEELLPPVLRHVGQAGVSPAAVTFLTPPSDENQSWLDNLPDDCDDVRVEVHAPKDRKKLSYLATTRGGRRLYVNRTVVDADQLILLCRPDADPLFAQGGAGLLFPTLSDEATRQELFHPERTPAQARALRTQAEEFAWLLGAPFLVQIIEGPADEIAGVIGGPVESHTEGERLYRAVWQRTVTELADTVVATVRGLGQRNRFASLARALAHASQMVQPEGRIILLSQADPHLGLGGKPTIRPWP
jgi:nickel-dependent lactate racemase